MYQRKIERTYDCGVELAMEVISGKWKPYIVCNIAKGIRRPSELLKVITNASKRVLAQQLKELEEHKIVHKKVFADEVPLRTDYYLTEQGEKLAPILASLVAWGEEYRIVSNSKMMVV